MDPQSDQKYLWIAKEGLKQNLPKHWKPVKAKDNNIFYFNFESKQLQKEHPCDEIYMNKFKSEQARENIISPTNENEFA